MENTGGLVSGNEERGRDTGRNVRPGSPTKPAFVAVELERELTVEDEDGLGTLVAEHENARPWVGTDLVCAELLEVDEHEVPA